MFKCFPQSGRTIRDNERIRCPGIREVSIAVSSSDLLNSTLISPGNTVRAHRQPIKITRVNPGRLPARKLNLTGPQTDNLEKPGNTVRAH